MLIRESLVEGALSLHRGFRRASLSQRNANCKNISPPIQRGAASAVSVAIDEPDKNWKLSLADIHEREYWKDYQDAYADCLHATSTHHAPWYIVPADDKENARIIVSRIILDTLSELKLSYPRTTAAQRADLLSIRKMLEK